MCVKGVGEGGGHQPTSTNTTVSVLQDPDRDCRPVDCAVKYRGQRNFYRNSTGRCERVVHCNTKGKDGVSVVAVSTWFLVTRPSAWACSIHHHKHRNVSIKIHTSKRSDEQ